MRKILNDIACYIAIVTLVCGGCYNILSVRPDIVVELPKCIQMVYWLAERIIEEPENNEEEQDDNSVNTQQADKSEGSHMHEWKTEEIATWQSNEDGTGRVVFVEIHSCDCGEELKE